MGEFRDPRESQSDIESVKYTDSFIVDDSMFIFPSDKGEEIKRGPNIGAPPSNIPLTDVISGSCWIKVGDKITTDHIMPAGQYLKYRSNIPRYSQVVFLPCDSDFASRAAALRDKGEGGFIVAGNSYGQGSSREHAAICLMYLGVKAVVAVSIERIHQANLCNFGILPLLFDNKEDYDKIEMGDKLKLESTFSSLEKGKFILKDETKGVEIPLTLFATDVQKKTLLKGGRLNEIKEDA